MRREDEGNERIGGSEASEEHDDRNADRDRDRDEDRNLDRADADHRRRMDRARRKRGTIVILILALVILLFLFVIRNSQEVPIDLIFTETNVPMIWVMIGCIVAGGIVGFVIGRPGRSFRFHGGRRDRDDARNPR